MSVDHPDHQRDIGPIGTASRIVAGAAAVAVPIALEGAGWWDIGTALIAFPLLSTGVAWLMTPADEGVGDDRAARDGGLCSARGCTLFAAMIGATVLLGVLTPVEGDVAFWGWLGVSMLLAAVRGYGGCEAPAFFNLLTGRRDQIDCLLFTPIDAAEARHRGGRTPAANVRLGRLGQRERRPPSETTGQGRVRHGELRRADLTGALSRGAGRGVRAPDASNRFHSTPHAPQGSGPTTRKPAVSSGSLRSG